MVSECRQMLQNDRWVRCIIYFNAINHGFMFTNCNWDELIKISRRKKKKDLNGGGRHQSWEISRLISSFFKFYNFQKIYS